jgi:histone deacetylase complex regulatory component SIN3
LLQAADFICTLNLISQKISDGQDLSKSEEAFFGSKKELRKKYLKYLNSIKFPQ